MSDINSTMNTTFTVDTSNAEEGLKTIINLFNDVSSTIHSTATESKNYIQSLTNYIKEEKNVVQKFFDIFNTRTKGINQIIAGTKKELKYSKDKYKIQNQITQSEIQYQKMIGNASKKAHDDYIKKLKAEEYMNKITKQFDDERAKKNKKIADDAKKAKAKADADAKKADEAQLKRAKKNFNANFGFYLSLMFITKQVANSINNFLKSSIKYFLDVTGYTNSFYQKIGDLSAEWNLFKYNFIEALSQNTLFQGFISGIQSMLEWFNNLSDGWKTFIAGSIAFVGGAAAVASFAASLRILFFSSEVKTASAEGGAIIGASVVAGIVSAIAGFSIGWFVASLFEKQLASLKLSLKLSLIAWGIMWDSAWEGIGLKFKIFISEYKLIFMEFGHFIQSVFKTISDKVVDTINFLVSVYKKLPFSNQNIPKLKYMQINDTEYNAKKAVEEANVNELIKQKNDLYSDSINKLKTLNSISKLKNLGDKATATELASQGDFNGLIMNQILGKDSEDKTTVVNIVMDGISTQYTQKNTINPNLYLDLAERNGAGFSFQN